MSYFPVKEIKVGLLFDVETIPVGRLAIRDSQIYFEYEDSFISLGIEISPYRLPLQAGLSTFDLNLFESLPGVFNDSLPDGWGRLLLDRAMRMQGILPEQLTPLDRLARVGENGMGALVYEPDYGSGIETSDINLDRLASHVQEVLVGEASELLNELVSLNGSSAGARPKAMISVDKEFKKVIHGNLSLPTGFEHWLVKFPTSYDGQDSGSIEYVYSLMARNAGVCISDTYLFSAKAGPGYFATKRFDRVLDKRLHAHSACGLLHSDFRSPSLDYEDLIVLTGAITNDVAEVEKMFRLAVFNVLANNKDDHAKNFTFLMNEAGEWNLAPAYDLTFSAGPNGEQSTMVMGEGRNITEEHFIRLGKEANISKKVVKEIILRTKESLSQWGKLAKEHGVSRDKINIVKGLMHL
jgi:serine/threonine-protein kinase HipA